jgi:hypothetical protein
MITDIKVNKPEPIAFSEKQKTLTQGTDVALVIEGLIKGKSILITDFYSDGLSLLQELHKYLKLKLPNKSFK